MEKQSARALRALGARIDLIEAGVYRRTLPLSLRHCVTGADGLSQEQVLEPDRHWGRWLQNFSLRSQFRVPEAWPRDLPLALYLPLGQAGVFSHPEALVCLDGEVLAACDRHHQELLLAPRVHDGVTHNLGLDGWMGPCQLEQGDPGSQPLLGRPALVQIDPPTRAFVARAKVAHGIIAATAEATVVRERSRVALERALQLVDVSSGPGADRFYASIPAALEQLQRELAAAGPAMAVDIVACGHAHLDLAWLWTTEQCRGKAARTFSTALALMDEDPDYRFSQSQPQLYAYVERDYPELFRRLSQRVEEGRFEAMGGMWVEADCNLPGAESLARQFLLGRRYFRERFGQGIESPVLWLPDVFGFPACLPQLAKLAGLEYFFTVKLDWNQRNRFPYHSFWWQGLDGTRILSHFSSTPDPWRSPTSTYTSTASPEEALGTWDCFQQKHQPHSLMMVYGHGDGGGGPTREMLANIRGMAQHPGSPRLRFGRVDQFFQSLAQEVGPDLPQWSGELYFEAHRGTYTSQARVKSDNRRAEHMLHDAELLATQAAQLLPSFGYPGQRFRGLWEQLCLQQFHDILPGSSIGEVYEDAARAHEGIFGVAQEIRDHALAHLARAVGAELLVFNPAPTGLCGVVDCPFALGEGQTLEGLDGRPVAIQRSGARTLLWLPELPAMSGLCLQVARGQPADLAARVFVDGSRLENERLRVEWDRRGCIVRIFDKLEARELLAAGGHVAELQAFEDRPLAWDAWEVDECPEQPRWRPAPEAEFRLLETGPLRATVEFRSTIAHSSYTQRISLSAGAARLDFETDIDWQERHVLLKVAFPLDLDCVRATYGVQWGQVERASHRNTSWEQARFESCGHRFVDLSESNFGVSLLCDDRYGYDIVGSRLRLSLLRAPAWPDPEADRGRHRLRYSLMTHRGPKGPETTAEAYRHGATVLCHLEQGSPQRGAVATVAELRPLVVSSHPSVLVETVKGAEDGRGFVVRIYECEGGRARTQIRCALKLVAAFRQNLIEDDLEDLPVTDGMIELSLRPFEIVSLRLVFGHP